MADAWARNLAVNFSCQLFHPLQLGLPQPYGQNLAKSSFSTSPLVKQLSNTDAVNLWVAEAINYTYAIFDGVTSGCITGNWFQCGHYTQVVWNRTLQVGCGSATCSSSKVWACDYFPPGNVLGNYPYVQSPCFRVSCPSNSTCSVSASGSAVCTCPSGQILVSGSCVPDPCKGVACPGTQTCNGTSGTPVCSCPSGTVASPSSNTTCTPVVCQGVACPSGSSCTATSSGVPICSCPSGQSFAVTGTSCVSGQNKHAASTSVALYPAVGYSGVPAVIRLAFQMCANIPSAYAGKIKSFQIVLQVNETLPSGSVASPCTDGVFFCPLANCNSVDCTGFPFTSAPSGLDPHIAGALSLLC